MAKSLEENTLRELLKVVHTLSEKISKLETRIFDQNNIITNEIKLLKSFIAGSLLKSETKIQFPSQSIPIALNYPVLQTNNPPMTSLTKDEQQSLRCNKPCEMSLKPKNKTDRQSTRLIKTDLLEGDNTIDIEEEAVCVKEDVLDELNTVNTTDTEDIVLDMTLKEEVICAKEDVLEVINAETTIDIEVEESDEDYIIDIKQEVFVENEDTFIKEENHDHMLSESESSQPNISLRLPNDELPQTVSRHMHDYPFQTLELGLSRNIFPIVNQDNNDMVEATENMVIVPDILSSIHNMNHTDTAENVEAYRTQQTKMDFANDYSSDHTNNLESRPGNSPIDTVHTKVNRGKSAKERMQEYRVKKKREIVSEVKNNFSSIVKVVSPVLLREHGPRGGKTPAQRMREYRARKRIMREKSLAMNLVEKSGLGDTGNFQNGNGKVRDTDNI